MVMWLVGTATVTTQGLTASATRRTKSGDFYLAKTGDSDLATSGDFFMATDTPHRFGTRHALLVADHHRGGFLAHRLLCGEHRGVLGAPEWVPGPAASTTTAQVSSFRSWVPRPSMWMSTATCGWFMLIRCWSRSMSRRHLVQHDN